MLKATSSRIIVLESLNNNTNINVVIYFNKNLENLSYELSSTNFSVISKLSLTASHISMPNAIPNDKPPLKNSCSTVIIVLI